MKSKSKLINYERIVKKVSAGIGLISILLIAGLLLTIWQFDRNIASASSNNEAGSAVTTSHPGTTNPMQIAMNMNNVTMEQRYAAAKAIRDFKANRTAAQTKKAASALAVTCPTCGIPGGIPDEFGTTPNYAESPIPPVVNITGGGGSNATAIATVNASMGGVITNITVINGGSGYTSAPNVTFTGFDGSGATATATINAGSVASINVTSGGIGYGGMRKFMDSLPGIGPTGANDLGNYIPVAVPDNMTFPGSDYYEIAVVQYSQKMHSDLNATTLRGYVQLETSRVKGNHIALTYPNGTNITNLAGVQVFAVDNPQYLGPAIVAQGNRPVRFKVTNYLPTGADGNLFIPTDTTIMGAGPGPLHANGTPCDSSMDNTCVNYTQNRIDVHLHGGLTAWTSDGTPHQWIVPAGENTIYPKGVSVSYVPDMWFNSVGAVVPAGTAGATNNPGNGSLTMYYTNQLPGQSARLMFYHDHAFGTTRLNVYVGMAAPYLTTDPFEQDLIAGTNVAGANPGMMKVLPDTGIPLVIQDKAFVPGPNQLKFEDPTWNWSTTSGSLWFPHVYLPNQNPIIFGNGMNAVGRWDYSPWFFPLQLPGPIHGPVPNPYYDPVNAPWEPQVMPGIPNPTSTTESFVDTPVVNGVAYPYLNVEPKAYRFRILSVANDRSFNLQLYVAPSNKSMWDANGNLIDPYAGDVNMVPAMPNASIPFPQSWLALTPDGRYPIILDGRVGGIPDPTFIGPSWYVIGNEGGFLPGVAVINDTPISYDPYRKHIYATDVLNKTLLLGPAERADVIVDFSKFAGKTIILYNDAPAAMPAYDTRNDYYTGDQDQTAAGGANMTLPGYGPNTRTIMQFRVNNTTPQPYNLTNLTTALPAAYGASQPKPIFPEAAYNAAFNMTYNNTYIYATDSNKSFFNDQLTGLMVTNGGSNYSSNPTVTISGGGGSGATAAAEINATGSVTNIILTDPGTGYTSAPNVNISGGGGSGATAIATPVKLVMNNKAIVEQFDNEYGRMDALLGSDLPFQGAGNATAIPYNYADSPTEYWNNTIPGTLVGTMNDGTQLWRIDHMGADTHLIHIHLINFQIVNRVSFDGLIEPPDPQELGWRDVVRANPMENVFIAFKPEAPKLPFSVPNSVRLDNPAMPLGATFRNAQQLTATNQLENFGWEYVWHCHILGHEENDMMRPVVFSTDPLRLTVFAKSASTNSVIDNKFNGASWDAWKDLGGNISSNVTATSSGNNITIFARNTADNTLWTQNWNGSTWSGWQSLGGIITGDPESVTVANVTYVFVRGSDNGVWYRNGTTGAWNPYQSLGGVIASDISATTSGSNITIFVRGSDNALWTQNWNGGSWSGWQNLGGVMAGDPSSVSVPNGTHVFVQGASDNAVWTKNWDGAVWSGWQNLGGSITGTPEVING